jgi:hypothetical protein
MARAERVRNEKEHWLVLTRSPVAGFNPIRDITGGIREIQFQQWFEEAPEPNVAVIRVNLDVEGTPDRFLWPSIELDYKNGKFRLRDTPPSGESRGIEYVTHASNSAMDFAIEEWVNGFTPDGQIQDARVGPPFPWRENPKDLPDGIGRIVHLTQRCHPFLREHHRRFRIELADARQRIFTLPTDGCDVSRTDILLIRQKRQLFLRIKDDSRTDLVIALDSLKIHAPDEYPQGDVVLTFPE